MGAIDGLLDIASNARRKIWVEVTAEIRRGKPSLQEIRSRCEALSERERNFAPFKGSC